MPSACTLKTFFHPAGDLAGIFKSTVSSQSSFIISPVAIVFCVI